MIGLLRAKAAERSLIVRRETVYSFTTSICLSSTWPVNRSPQVAANCSPMCYMEPSYLIWTCCKGAPVTGSSLIAPVVWSRVGLMKTWYTLVTVDRTFPFLSSDCPVTKTRKLRLRVVARL
jgi:hypothetical protein